MKEALKNLILSKNKRIKTNIIMKIISSDLEIESDDIEIILFDNYSIYKNLYLIKGDIFPTPKNNDIIKVKELYLKHDDNLNIKLYLNAKILVSEQKFIEPSNIGDIIYLDGKKLLPYFTNLLNIKEEKIFDSVFIIKNIDNKSNFYKIFNFHDLKEYNVSINSIDEPLNKDEYILINNFKIKKDKEIITFELTMINKLKEEKFFQVLYRFIDQNNSDIFKVIYKEKNHFILINKLKKLFILEHSIINANLGKILFIANFNLKKIDNVFQLIILNENTYMHISKEDFYFSKNLKINTLSCIKFYIKDFIENNEYNIIKIFNEVKEINNKEIIFILSTFNNKYFDYFPIEINLYHTSQKEELHKTFHFLLYKGFLNKINLFVNVVLSKSYFFEYFYLDISNKLDNLNGLLTSKNEIKENFAIDNFDSENRKRINLMNVAAEKFEFIQKFEKSRHKMIN